MGSLEQDGMAELAAAPTEPLVAEFRAALRALTDPEVSDVGLDRLLEEFHVENRPFVRGELRYLVTFVTSDEDLMRKIRKFQTDSKGTYRLLASVPELRRFVDAAKPPPKPKKKRPGATAATRRSKRASGPAPNYAEGDRRAAADDSDASTSDEEADAYRPSDDSDDSDDSSATDNEDVLERPRKRAAPRKKAPRVATLHNALARGRADACFDMTVTDTRRATMRHDRLTVDETEVTHLLVQKGDEEVRAISLLDRPLCTPALDGSAPVDGEAAAEARTEAVNDLLDDLRYALRVDQQEAIDELLDDDEDDDGYVKLTDDELLEQLVEGIDDAYPEELASGFDATDAVVPDVVFAGESSLQPATQYQDLIDDMLLSRLEEVFSDTEVDALDAGMAVRDADDDRAVLQCMHQLESGSTMANMLLTSTRVVGQATDDELETLPFVVGFVLRNGDRVALKQLTRGGGKRRAESAAAAPGHTPKWKRSASSGDSAATTWRRENNVRDAGQRMMTSYATDFDLENVHPELHRILGALPPNRTQMVSVREEKRGKAETDRSDDKPRKYILLAQFRDPKTGKQVLVRHGYFISEAFATLLGKWLYRQPQATLGRTKAAREFAEELFPAAFAMRDPMIGHDVVVENDVLRDTTTNETRALLPDQGLPPRFRLLDVGATTGKFTYREAGTNEKTTMLMPFLKPKFGPDFDWDAYLLFDPGPAPALPQAELSAEASAEISELLASTAILPALNDA